jgi:hypothetical protein
MQAGFGAQNWIRTSTPLRALRPEHSASTNFAIWAFLVIVIQDCKCKGKCRNSEMKKSLIVHFFRHTSSQ